MKGSNIMLLITAILLVSGALCFSNDGRVLEIIGASLLVNIPIALAYYFVIRNIENP